MMRKFQKNREVDSTWLNIPIKYMLKVKGANKGRREKYVYPTLKEAYQEEINICEEEGWNIPTFEEFKKEEEKFPILTLRGNWIKSKKDKTFCIIELSKNWAICGWRNTESCSIGMPIKCKVVTKNKKVGIIYKDKFYPITEQSGWVF